MRLVFYRLAGREPHVASFDIRRLKYRNQQAVALKILKQAGAPRREFDILQKLSESAPDGKYSEHVIRLLYHFEHNGLEGAHLCLVFDLMWQDACAFIRGFHIDIPHNFRLPGKFRGN
jgi:hypothetical protein